MIGLLLAAMGHARRSLLTTLPRFDFQSRIDQSSGELTFDSGGGFPVPGGYVRMPASSGAMPKLQGISGGLVGSVREVSVTLCGAVFNFTHSLKFSLPHTAAHLIGLWLLTDPAKKRFVFPAI